MERCEMYTIVTVLFCDSWDSSQSYLQGVGGQSENEQPEGRLMKKLASDVSLIIMLVCFKWQ